MEEVYFGGQMDFSEDFPRIGDGGTAWAGGVDSPVFSIMMAVYNDTSLLNAAINSCLRQTCHSWELLILDNSDKNGEPWRMIENAMAYDGRIRGFRSERNLGWAKGSQVLLGHARGAYVTFLSADDCLCPGALSRIEEEVCRHDPDVVFVGNVYANYLGGRRVEKLGVMLPEYRLYVGGCRSEALVEIMKNVYYNSMFHYEKRSFLEENGMDFFEPYYGDCATMTYAITRAERMVVLPMAAYSLTMNTSQSTGNYGVSSQDYIFGSQWRSARALFQREGYDDRKGIGYVARRIFQNYVASLKALCIGRWRDKYMNPLEGVTLPDIVSELGTSLKSDDVGELFFLMGDMGFDALVKNVASIKIFPEKEILDAARGCWLEPLFRLVLGRRKMSRGEKLETMCDFILEEENIWCIGIYAFQKLAEQCGEEEWNSLDRLDQVHQKYERMKKGMVDDGKEIFVHGLDDGFSLRGRGMS
ncbi:MAG: glycosyltransferase family 2 protein [Lachnospiraceae bacterium]|nr:glycosyltransferase family 2 protein [Lachnospiraceae bacterium]